jgi:predicted MFS family arabinose efflux permease
MKELLKNKVFQIIMATDTIQQMSIWIRNMAVLFFVIEQTNADPVAISLITIFEYLPIFVFSYFGGAMADKWNPKKTMIAGDSLSALSVLVILFLIVQGYWQAVFAATLVSSIVTQFSAPSSVIMFKRNIDEHLITPAISISQGMLSLYLIIGPIIGTFLYETLGIQTSLTIIAAMFFLSSMVQFMLPNSPRKAELANATVMHQLKEGLVYIYHDNGLRVLFTVLAIFGFATGLIQPLTVFILTDRLGIDAQNLQWFYALTGVGLLVGAILSITIVNKIKTGTVLVLCMLVFAVLTATEAFSTLVFITAPLYFLSGVTTAFVQVAISSPLIKTVPEEYVGRVNGMVSPLLIGGLLIGAALSGVLMKELTLIPVYMISVFFILVCSVISRVYKDTEITITLSMEVKP